MSLPSKVTLPAVGSSSRVTRRAVVLFPQPDSPTIEKVSPRRTSKSTPSTAWTALVERCRNPPPMGKCLTSPSTWSKASRGAAGAAVFSVLGVVTAASG